MRYIILAIAAILFFNSCKSKNEAPQDPDTYYTCSMDPQVVEYKPGKCPICKMDLTPVKKKNGENLFLYTNNIDIGPKRSSRGDTAWPCRPHKSFTWTATTQ